MFTNIFLGEVQVPIFIENLRRLPFPLRPLRYNLFWAAWQQNSSFSDVKVTSTPKMVHGFGLNKMLFQYVSIFKTNPQKINVCWFFSSSQVVFWGLGARNVLPSPKAQCPAGSLELHSGLAFAGAESEFLPSCWMNWMNFMDGVWVFMERLGWLT